MIISGDRYRAKSGDHDSITGVIPKAKAALHVSL